jgi:ubiquinone/menaquinone biosynthesis C-methylase UbiE
MTYRPSEEWIIEQCKGKTVLHLGCAGDYTLQFGKEACLQYRLAEVACKITGVDINKESLEKILPFCPESDSVKYHIGNVEHLNNLNIGNQKFDVIVAGSIIEHLSNPGLMLDSIRSFCYSDGEKESKLIIVTPHVWGLLQFLRVAFTRNEAVNPEHTCWYSVPTLTELCSRYGFKSVEFKSGYGFRPDSVSWSIKKSLGSAFFGLFPHLGGSLLATFRYQSA